MSILTETAPRRIYLCISDDEAHYDEPWPERYPEDEEITWSVDQPVACTVEYVRADLRADADKRRAEEAFKAMRRQRNNAIREHDRATTLHAIAVKERDFERTRVDRLAVENDQLKADLDAARAVLRLAKDACRLVRENKPVPWHFLENKIHAALAAKEE